MDEVGGFSSTLVWLVPLILVVWIFVSQVFKILREYERAVVFRLGKFQTVKGPGLIMLIPFIDKIQRVDLRVLTINVDKQEVITKDNVTVYVDAINFFRVVNAEAAVIQVEQYIHATSMLAQTTLRSTIGQVELDELLAERDKINKHIQKGIDEQTEPWGIKVVSVEVRDVVLPENMKRAMASQAETERVRRAKVINAEGEFQAAKRLVDAAEMIETAPAALQLRFLQTMSEVASEHTSYVFMPIPMDFMEAFQKMNPMDKSGFEIPKTKKAKDKKSTDEKSENSGDEGLDNNEE
ncbi:MAG TPA: SPFH domain-containing protein [Flavobacteriaceae bacterium]|nr:SPFH domain-containing protein [Flavobacteriaceae bacterium]